MAEAHPVGFQWVIEAKRRGAKIIHVDPRFTRTSAVAHKHIAIRGGTDVVLLGALIKYVLDNEYYFHDYVLAYTNASTIINRDFEDTEDLDGIFSGYDPETGKYDFETWGYEPAKGLGPDAAQWNVERDETLQDPNTVFQILKRHYSRYTPEMVEEICGIPPEDFQYLADSIVENSGRERTTCMAYALGWTQHTLVRNSFAPRPFCSCSWAISDAPAPASWRCAGTPPFRAPRTFPRCLTCCRDICPCPPPRSRRLRNTWQTSTPRTKRASGSSATPMR